MPAGDQPLFAYEQDLEPATLEDRPNRFTARVDIDGQIERVYLRNSGGLETVLESGREALCRPAANPDRKTDYDLVAVRVGETWVTVDSILPNEIVESCIERNCLSQFEGYRLEASEPPLPDEGRADFRLRSPAGDEVYVEVKSNTYVVDGVSKFPDRPTERGRRHLRSLIDLANAGTECHVVFVVQRPDATRFQPFREVDPEFADLLARADEAGVTIGALSTAFDPPHVTLHEPDLPVELG